MKTLFILLLFCAATLHAQLPSSIAISGTASTKVYALTQTFSDEFNGPLSLYDPKTGLGTWKTWYYWGGQTSSSGRVEKVVSCIFSDSGYNGVNPFSVAGGVLTIQANNNPNYPAKSKMPFTSGVITTEKSFSQLYGYFEIRCKTSPMAAGIWPAFWMLSTTQQATEELDIMEDFAIPNFVSSTIHYLHAPTFSRGHAAKTADTTAWHTYGMLWLPDEIYFYRDREQTWSLPNPGFHDAEYLIACLQTGADGCFLGSPSPASIPANMAIDYIRAYQVTPAPVPVASVSPTPGATP